MMSYPNAREPQPCSREMLENPGSSAQLVGGLALCDGCTLDCSMYRLVEQNVQFRGTINAQEAENLRLVERLLDLRIDTLVNESFTPEGLRDFIAHEENGALAERLATSSDWGVLRLDGRFVSFINTFGNLQGDRLLQTGGTAIYEASATGIARQIDRRSQDAPVEEDRRSGEERRRVTAPIPGLTLEGDLFIRQGGDEFAVLVFNVTPAGLANMARRVEAQLSVAACLARQDNPDILPFIASVGQSHAVEVTRNSIADTAFADVLSSQAPEDYSTEAWVRFNLVNTLADAEQLLHKKHQYREMWNMVVQTVEDASMLPSAPNDREIAQHFLERFFADTIEALRNTPKRFVPKLVIPPRRSRRAENPDTPPPTGQE